MVTISDKKIGVDENTDGTVDYYNADVITANDYYPFGSQMPGRKYSALSSSYRYGFNGKENDNEVKGEGNQQDYGLRIYDPRLGKFLSIDPLTKDYPWYTPYQFAGNKPIEAIDLDGAEEFYINQQSRVKHEAQLKHVVDERTKVIAAYKNQTILAADIFGNGHIGPRYVVESNIAAVRQNYYNAIGNNIRGGPFGAAGYLIAGDKGSFYGAVADNVALSFGGIPGESSVLSRPNNMSQVKPMSSTEIAPYEHAPLHLTINLKQNWNKEQVTEAFEKAQTITNNLNAKVTLKNPEPRPSNLRKDYLKQGGTLTKGQQLDHTTDLQVNGTNDKSNLRGINGSVNMSFGAQLNMQIRNMPDNTRVRTVTINPFPIKKN